MQAVRLDGGTDYRRLRAGNTAFGGDGGWNMRGMGSQADPELVVTSRAACYNTQKRPGGVAHHAEEIGDHGAGADPRRIPTAAGRSPGAGGRMTAALAGNPLRHGYPGQRAAIHHRGGGAKRRGGNRPEGQDQNHSAAHETLPQAAEIRQKVRHRPRTDIPDEKGKRAVPEVHLGGDEKAVRGGKGGAEQGVPSQPAGAIRPDVLRRLPGCGTAGGRAGSQQHRDDPDLPVVHGKRKCPPAGQARSAQRVGIIIIPFHSAESVQ